ncbi:hypothetical protein, partial [Domibacillus robiginosus]|uniref:hypothetical protein n=1 Tax=Domibacillus robiginosus TaxID=1071054 RepID=UPI000B0DF071
ASAEDREELDEPEEKEHLLQAEAQNEIEESEASAEDREELDEPEKKEHLLQAEAQNEIGESEASAEDREELKEPEEKEHLLQAEAQNEITESEAPLEDREEQEESEAKEHLLQVEAQNEITESGSPRDNAKAELEKQRNDPLKQIKKAKYTIKRQMTASDSDKEVITGEKVTTDILAVRTRENILQNSLEDPFHDTQSQKNQKRKSTKAIKAEKGKPADSIIEESCTPPPLEIMAEEKQEVWLPVMTSEEIEKQLERQYYSLMKQAEKKYKALREKRMERKMMKK